MLEYDCVLSLINFNAQVQYPPIPSSLSAALAQTNVTTGICSPAISAGFYHQPVLNAQYTPYSSYSPFQHSPSLPLPQPNPGPQLNFTPPFHGHPTGPPQGHHQGQEQPTDQGYGGYSCRQELFPPNQQ